MNNLNLKKIKTIIIIIVVLIIIIMVMIEGCFNKKKVKFDETNNKSVDVVVPEPAPDIKSTQPTTISYKKTIIGKWLLIELTSDDGKLKFKDPSKITAEQRIVYEFSSNTMTVRFQGNERKTSFKWITKDTIQTIMDKSNIEYKYATENSRVKIVDDKLYMTTKDTAGMEANSVFIRIGEPAQIKKQVEQKKTQNTNSN